MMPNKSIFYIFFIFMIFQLTFVHSESLNCFPDNLIANMHRQTCTTINKGNITTYAGEVPYPHSVKKDRPVLSVAQSLDESSTLNASGIYIDKLTYQTKLVEVPFFDLIKNSRALKKNSAGLLPFKNDGWDIFGESVTYYGKPDQEGFNILCITAFRKINNAYVGAARCDSFYQDEIDKFRSDLDKIVATFN